jgi:ribosomal protein S18 acetylase RimI-like enzyme
LVITYRLARQEDVRVLERLFEEFSGWQLERSVSISKAIDNPDGELLVAEVDDKIVGLIHQVFFEDPLHAGLNSYITDFFVKEEHRKKGIGSELLKRALETAKTREVKEVHVTTRENNYGAMKFYEKYGFSRAGVLFELNP